MHMKALFASSQLHTFINGLIAQNTDLDYILVVGILQQYWGGGSHNMMCVESTILDFRVNRSYLKSLLLSL